MNPEKITVNGNSFKKLELQLQNAKLVMLIAEKGYLACGYFDINMIEKLNDCACIIRGVKSAEEMLDKEIAQISTKARELGIKEGMTGKEAILKML